MSLKRWFVIDEAENSIMQTITIAISAILIAAGVVTAPGLINSSRDGSAKADLANISYAQEYRFANSGSYAGDITAFTTGHIKLTLSGDTTPRMISNTDHTSYVVFDKSASGKVYWRGSAVAKTFLAPDPWTDTPPAEYPPALDWPSSADNAISGDNMITSTNGADWIASRWYGDGAVAGNETVETGTESAPFDSAMRKHWTQNVPKNNVDTGMDVQKVDVVPGQTYNVSAYLRPTSMKNADIAMYWYDSDGNDISRDNGPSSAIKGGWWSRVSGVFTAPDNAASVLVVADIGYGQDNWKAGEALDGSGAQMTVGSKLYPYPGVDLNR
jgi:hypothetical protein